MADNTELNAGTGGDVIASDDIGGVKYQRVKLTLGANNTSDGDVASGNPMPVSGSVTVSGTVTANLSSLNGAATSAKQDTIIGHVDGIEGLLTTIDGDTSALAAAIAGTEVQVDIVAALPAGNNNIGDVDVASLPALTTGDNTVGRVKLTDGTDVADVLDLANSNPLVVALVDTNGDQISSFGGGTQYTEDAAAAANPVGTVPILVRKDTPASEVTTDGDNIAQRGTAYGAAYVTLLDTGGSAVSVGGGTQYDEDTASADAQKLTMAGVTRADTAASQVNTDGDRSTLIVDASGRLHVNVGNTVTVGAHAVTNAGTFATQVDGAALTALQLIDDGVYTDDTSTHATGTSKGYGMMAAATPTDTAVNANDIGMVGMTNNRELYVSLRDIAGTTAVTGSGNATGALRVEVANNGTGLVTVNPATAANWGVYVEDAGETAGGNLAMAGSVRRDTAASSAGTTADNATINTSAEGALWGTLTPTTTSGCSVFMASGSDGSSILVATAQAAKASAGNLYAYYAYNPESAVTFVHFYNTASGSVTVGTTNPLFTLPIPATSAANLALPYPVSFSTAITVAATTTAGGNTAPSTGVSLVLFYK